MRPLEENTNADLGFQIAPLIDVIFVILVFFMALAGQIKIEQILATRLPGTAPTAGPVAFVDEQVITITSDGEVLLNDEPHDSPTSTTLPQLGATLSRLRDNARAAQTQLVVTIVSAEDASYARTIDVLNLLAALGVTNVSFTVEAET